MSLLPEVALVHGWAVLRKVDVNLKLMQALCPAHGSKDIDEALAVREQSAPTASCRLGDHVVDGDLAG